MTKAGRRDNMDDSVKQDFTRRIALANDTQLVVILYEMVLEYLRMAGEAEDITGTRDAIAGARRCIDSLTDALDMRYSPSKQLLSLYVYCNRQLIAADARKDVAALAAVESVITGLRDAYAAIADSDTSGPAMNNAEAVYMGMTYGRNSLPEISTVGGGERGIMA